MASEKRNSDHATKLHFSAGSVFGEQCPPNPQGDIPNRKAASAAVVWVSAPVQIAVKLISQIRCQPDANSEQKLKKSSSAKFAND